MWKLCLVDIQPNILIWNGIDHYKCLIYKFQAISNINMFIELETNNAMYFQQLRELVGMYAENFVAFGQELVAV